MISESDQCLIVETNFLIHLDLEDMMRSHGFQSVDHAANIQQAQELLKTRHYRVAFLDLNLDRQSNLPLVRVLRKHRIPFAITTTFYDESTIPPDLHGVPIITKPYSTTAVTTTLQALLGSSPSGVASDPHIL